MEANVYKIMLAASVSTGLKIQDAKSLLKMIKARC
jgi:hypothetical protein